ncbi:Late embryogenesis abundant protein SMP subgroup [Arabidopsis thaliana x Arabidopsis arenosa]|uniref:Late embryogenesis abundant protein SMP subgroup n=1 Tax=Arabidopsis thaliana x Arabidopsis arenosa TaxID=1240361 RepID=A0A8T2BXR4_9BRAS|nr:Late embryogenesis abundant protein SMP subgroup [Arabidopsis thaliana x Arabidopsis arenosa]
MAQHQHSPQRPRDQENTRPHDQYGDVSSVYGDDVARKQGVSFSQSDPTVATMGSVDTVTIGEALEATALSLGDKPVDRKDAAAIQAAETRATGECKGRPGGLAVAAQAAAATNEQTVSGEEKVTIADILTDAAEKLPGDKVVTCEDAEAVVGAELGSSSEMKTTPGGVADSMSAGARLNQQI